MVNAHIAPIQRQIRAIPPVRTRFHVAYPFQPDNSNIHYKLRRILYTGVYSDARTRDVK